MVFLGQNGVKQPPQPVFAPFKHLLKGSELSVLILGKNEKSLTKGV
jgi:hypothetical protein